MATQARRPQERSGRSPQCCAAATWPGTPQWSLTAFVLTVCHAQAPTHCAQQPPRPGVTPPLAQTKERHVSRRTKHTWLPALTLLSGGWQGHNSTRGATRLVGARPGVAQEHRPCAVCAALPLAQPGPFHARAASRLCCGRSRAGPLTPAAPRPRPSEGRCARPKAALVAKAQVHQRGAGRRLA